MHGLGSVNSGIGFWECLFISSVTSVWFCFVFFSALARLEEVASNAYLQCHCPD